MIIVVAAASFSAGSVLGDARARCIPNRRAFISAALRVAEWPLFPWLCRHARPKRTLEGGSGGAARS